MLLSIVSTLYLHILLRNYILACLRRKHSLTFLKKCKKSTSLFQWFTGFYLLKDNLLPERWLRPVLYAVNISLLSIPLASLVGVLVLSTAIAVESFRTICTLFLFKDIAVLCVLILLSLLKK